MTGRRETRTVALGGRTWAVRPLTLAQLQDVEVIQGRHAAGALSTVAYSAEVVAVGLDRDHAEAAAEVRALDVEATLPELSAASMVVLRLGGFLPEEGGSGEPKAGAAPASTGDGSTPA